MSGRNLGRLLRAQSRWAWILLLIGVLAVYLLTLSPGVLGGDPGELQFVPHILSMTHPTGTPLYCLLGKVWSTLPLGPSVAWRMNLLAAVSATSAAVVVYHCAYARLQRAVPALAAALSLAFGLTFWEQALLADKYAFNALMVALVLYLALRWGRTRSLRTLYLLALAYGLSLAHHRTMALFAPTLLGYVWWHERGELWRDRRRLLRLAVLCLAPLLLYLYLPWAESRNLPPGTWQPRTIREWSDYLFDPGYTGLVYVNWRDLVERLSFYARILQHDFTWIGVWLGIGGLAWQFHRRWPDALFTMVSYLLQVVLAANYRVPRHWIFFIPSFLIFALWVGEGLSGIWLGFEWLVQKTAGHAASIAIAFLALAMLAWPLTFFPERYRPLRQAHLGVGVLDIWRQRLKQGHMGDRMGRAIAHVEPDAVIVCDWEQATPLWYFQQVEGLRPDVQIVYPIQRLDEAAARGRPLYIARTYPGLSDRWRPSCSGPLIALRYEPIFDLPSDAAPLGLQLGDTFELAGFAYGEADFYPATVVSLTLYWRVFQSPAHDYSVSLRLFDLEGGQVYQVDSQHPVLGTYPTSKWATGEVVGDYYEIQLSPELSPGPYQWGVILYRALPEGGWEGLKVAGTDQEVAMGDTFEVRRR